MRRTGVVAYGRLLFRLTSLRPAPRSPQAAMGWGRVGGDPRAILYGPPVVHLARLWAASSVTKLFWLRHFLLANEVAQLQ